MSKRIILGLIAGTAVFGSVFGLAASLTVGSEKLSASEIAVTSCDADGVHTAYTYDPVTGLVTDVVVSDIDDACVGFDVVARVHGSGGYLTHGEGTVAAGTADDNSTSLALGTGQDPEDIIEVEVILNGVGTGAVAP